MIKAIVLGHIAHDKIIYNPAKKGCDPVVIELKQVDYDCLLSFGVIAPVDETIAVDEATAKARRKAPEQV